VAQAASFVVNTNDDHDDTVCNAADCSLREAINAANGDSRVHLSPRGCRRYHSIDPNRRFERATLLYRHVLKKDLPYVF